MESQNALVGNVHHPPALYISTELKHSMGLTVGVNVIMFRCRSTLKPKWYPK